MRRARGTDPARPTRRVMLVALRCCGSLQVGDADGHRAEPGVLRSAPTSGALSVGELCSVRAPFTRTFERRAHELAEERRRPRGPRLELRMELRSDEPR